MMKKTLMGALALFLIVSGFPAWAKKADKNEEKKEEKKQQIKLSPPKDLNQQILGTQWSQSLQSGSSKKYYPESASPLLFDNKIYVGTHSGLFYALDAAQGHILWQFKSNGPIASQPASDGSRVYFGNNKGTVYALDASSGKSVWDHFIGGEILAEPALSNGVLYVVTTSREVYALDSQTGDEKWSQFVRGFEKKFTVRGTAPVVVSGSNLYIGFADGQVTSLSLKGDILWTRFLAEERTAFKDIDSRILVEGNAIFAVGYYGFVARLDAKTGDIIWKSRAHSGSDMETDGSTLYLSTRDGKVMAFDKVAGTLLWSTALNTGPLSAPCLVNGYLLVGTQQRGAYVLSSDQGQLLQHLSISPGFIGNISSNGSSLVFLSSSGKVVSVGLAKR